MSVQERRFVVLGKTGNGKSSSINTIVGENVCKASASSQSVTKECQLVEEIAHGKRLVIVDTPGLFDTDSTEEETRKEIGKIIGLTSPGFHAFIVVIRIGRFTAEEISAVEILVQMFGAELYERAVVLFTGKDDLEADDLTFDDYIAKHVTRDLRGFLDRCGNRVVAFNNRSRSDTRQAEMFLKMVDDIVKAKGNSYYTNEMYEKATRIIEEEEQRRRRENMSKSESEVRQEIRQDIAKETPFGKKLLSILIDRVAIPVAKILAKQTVKFAKREIAKRCSLS